MSVRVLLPNAFQKHTNGARRLQSSASNLPELIDEIEITFPALKTHLRDEHGPGAAVYQLLCERGGHSLSGQ